jgi:branched-chain amino acid transport system permease protein
MEKKGTFDISRLNGYLGKLGLKPLGFLLIILLAVIPLIITDQFWIRLLTSTLMMAALAMAFDFSAGFININNFGLAAFWGLGAYTSGLLAVNLGLSPWLGMLAGALAAAVLGFLVGLLTLRLSGIFASCMTWFVALALMALTTNWVELTRGSSGLSTPYLVDSLSNIPYYYVMLIIAIGVLILLRVITNSHIGMAFKAIGQDKQAAEASGINFVKYRIFNMTLSCALAGLVGGFYAHYTGVITPTMMHTSNTVEALAICYVGGRGSIWGAILSAFILVPAMELMKGMMEVRMIIYGVLLILVMLVYPAGLAGLCNALYKFMKDKGLFRKFGFVSKNVTGRS